MVILRIDWSYNSHGIFTKTQDSFERVGKVAGDIFCALIILAFSIMFFGVVGGILAFVLLDGAMIGVEYLMPTEDDAPGASIR